MKLEELGVVGNCQFSALIHNSGEVVWCCLPRFDSEPVFSTLLDAQNGGRFQITAAGGEPGTLRYLPNTNILETKFETSTGSFRVIDFAPRFLQYGRAFRPTQLVRIIEPIEGTPRITVLCEPRLGWSKERPSVTQGSHHIQFDGFASPLRLTTDLPLSYLNGKPFSLTERQHMILTWGAPLEEPLAPVCERFWSETSQYWQRWVKQCDIPPLFQQEVIRSALTLKLHCFEDTGAIIAAMTTSIPESRQRPYLGLPLLLAARFLLRFERLLPIRSIRGTGAICPIPAECGRGRGRPESGAALSRGWIFKPAGSHSGELARLQRRGSRSGLETAPLCILRTTSTGKWCWR